METHQFWAFFVIAIIAGASIALAVSGAMTGYLTFPASLIPQPSTTTTATTNTTCASVGGSCRQAANCTGADYYIDQTKTCPTASYVCCRKTSSFISGVRIPKIIVPSDQCLSKCYTVFDKDWCNDVCPPKRPTFALDQCNGMGGNDWMKCCFNAYWAEDAKHGDPNTNKVLNDCDIRAAADNII